MLKLPKEMHRQHYEVICSDYLAKLFHYLYSPAYSPVFDYRFNEAWNGYRRINRLFAHAVAKQHSDEVLLVQDTHLMLLAAQLPHVVRGGIKVPKLYFHHVPWCTPDYFAMLPEPVRKEMLAALLQFDVVGLHSNRWVASFVDCCNRFLAGCSSDGNEVRWRGRRTRILPSPAPLDAEPVRTMRQSTRTDEWIARFRLTQAGRWTLVRVDRADLWKNVLRGFLAFDALIERRPDLADQLLFLAILSPTRMWLPENRHYLHDCIDLADRINQRWTGRGVRAPIALHLEPDSAVSDRCRAFAGLHIADAVLVNSIFDGLNLVAKEAVLIGERPPVIILSENTGAYDEMADAVLGINPFDVKQTARAIERAYALPPAERVRRARRLRRMIEARTTSTWIEEQLASLPDVTK